MPRLFLVFALFAVSTSIFSQTLDRASVSGRVTDESGAVVAGCIDPTG